MNLLKAGLCIAVLAPSIGQAAVTRLTENAFTSTAGKITFSEYAIRTQNPTYNPSDYGANSNSPKVTFGGYFKGQSLSQQPAQDCPGAAASACIVGSPSGSLLSLDSNAPKTFIARDSANPTSPVLSGSPKYNGGVAILFSKDQYAVGFTGGYFDAVASTAITAFARDGSLIGSVKNTKTGIEFLGLASSNLSVGIAGVFLDLVGNEPAGFAIDNIRFGLQKDVNPVPVPAGFWLLGSGLLALVKLRKKNA